MPTTINDKLISWASDIDPGTIRQAEKTARLPDRRGPRRPHARRPRRHRRHRRLGHPDQGRRHPGGRRRRHRLRHDRRRARRHRGPAARRARAAARPHRAGHPGRCRPGPRRRRPQRRPRGWPTHRPATELAAEQAVKAAKQFGTLGSGNHFFELCVDERGRVWVVLHSGSRGIGNQLAQMHIAKARAPGQGPPAPARGPRPGLLRGGHAGVRGLHRRHALGPGLRPGQPRPDDGQRHARGASRSSASAGRRSRINCHHNFTQREVHGGQELWITRKGAIKADAGDLGVIPGSMGTRSYIVAGQGQRRRAGRRARTAPAAATAAPRPRSSSPPPTSPQQMEGKVWLAERADALVDEIPVGLQGHRPGHGRPGRPGRGPAHAAPGPQLQGHLRRQPTVEVSPARNRARRAPPPVRRHAPVRS